MHAIVTLGATLIVDLPPGEGFLPGADGLPVWSRRLAREWADSVRAELLARLTPDDVDVLDVEMWEE